MNEDKYKVLTYNYFEGHIDLDKHEIPRHIVNVKVYWHCFEADVVISDSGISKWLELLKDIVPAPVYIKRSLGEWGESCHCAQLYFLTKEDAKNACSKLFYMQPNGFS